MGERPPLLRLEVVEVDGRWWSRLWVRGVLFEREGDDELDATRRVMEVQGALEVAGVGPFRRRD